MTTNRVLILVLACAFTGGAVTAAPRSADTSTVQSRDLSAATKKKKKSRRPAPPPRQIACTFFGCRPVPAGCYQREGFDFWGNPTGFDVIICPGR